MDGKKEVFLDRKTIKDIAKLVMEDLKEPGYKRKYYEKFIRLIFEKITILSFQNSDGVLITNFGSFKFKKRIFRNYFSDRKEAVLKNQLIFKKSPSLQRKLDSLMRIENSKKEMMDYYCRKEKK